MMKKRGLPPLTFEQAVDWYDLEIDPCDIPIVLRHAALRIAAPRRASHHPASQRTSPPKDDAPWDSAYFEERLSRGRLDEQG